MATVLPGNAQIQNAQSGSKLVQGLKITAGYALAAGVIIYGFKLWTDYEDKKLFDDSYLKRK